MVSFDLPWPHKDLSPNARKHWGAKSEIVNKSRSDAFHLACEAGVKRNKIAPNHVSLVFYPPDNRNRDLDNMLASLKSALDGVADACGVDDSTWKISLRKEPCDGKGRVSVKLEVA